MVLATETISATDAFANRKSSGFSKLLSEMGFACQSSPGTGDE